jgi:nucleoside-diphosphate-sugar epimerase
VKIFVTGGSGYVGQPTIRALRKRGHEVSALARSDAAGQIVSALGATLVRGGMEDEDILRRAAAEADGAIHLAVVREGEPARLDRSAAAAIQDGIGNGPYVHTGGTWVYGNTAGVVNEDTPFAPPPLVAWRFENEKRVLDRAATGGNPVMVMPGLVYGDGGGLIERFVITPARTRGSVHYVGEGGNHWSLVHVEDLADLYARALGAPAGAIYAGVTDYHFTVRELAPALSEAAGCPGHVESVTLEQSRVEIGPIAEGFALDQQVSGARARSQLGWDPPERDVPGELRLSSL